MSLTTQQSMCEDSASWPLTRLTSIRNLKRPLFLVCKHGAALTLAKRSPCWEFFSKKASTSHLLPTSETAPHLSSAGYVYVHPGEQAAQCHSREMAKLLGMKVRNTSFLGLWGCSLYKPVFLSGSVCSFTRMRGLEWDSVSQRPVPRLIASPSWELVWNEASQASLENLPNKKLWDWAPATGV